MAKPDRPVRWANDGASIVEPSEAEKNTGWDPSTRPPAEWLNWIQRQNYFWNRYTGNVPSANLFKRNAIPVIPQNSSLILIDAIPGQGAEKYTSGPSDKHDEWWLGTVGIGSPNASRLWRYTRGLNARGVGVDPADTSILEPRKILYDGAQYLLVGQELGGDNAFSETSVGGLVWINNQPLPGSGATQDVSVVWNGKTGASHRYVAIEIDAFGGTVHMSDDSALSWSLQAPGTGANAIAYSPVSDKFCIVATTGSVGKQISIGNSTGDTWVQATVGTAPDDTDYRGVVALPNGEFLMVGDDDASPTGVIVISSSGATVFDTVPIIPDVAVFHGVRILGNRVVVTCEEKGGGSANGITTYESLQAGISGSWRRSGELLVSTGSTGIGPFSIRTPMAMTDSDTVFAGSSGLVSEQRTPNLED